MSEWAKRNADQLRPLAISLIGQLAERDAPIADEVSPIRTIVLDISGGEEIARFATVAPDLSAVVSIQIMANTSQSDTAYLRDRGSSR
jgi:hypothetical protein